METIRNRLHWLQCEHRRNKELGESGQLYGFDQTDIKAELGLRGNTIDSANPNSDCDDSKSDLEILEKHCGSECTKGRLRAKERIRRINAPFFADVNWLIYNHTDMLLSNRDGMEVEERGYHSHGPWKLGRRDLQAHQPRFSSKEGESQRKSRSNYFSPCYGGACSFKWCGLR